MLDPTSIIVRECDQQNSFRIMMDLNYLNKFFFSTAEEVLDLMIEEGLTLMPDRKAAWVSLLIKRGSVLEKFSVEKIGTTFPNEPFGEGCCFASQEKTARTFNNQQILSSYENRQPLEKRWGGSAKFIFDLVSLRGGGSYDYVTVISAPSGLKEWEDLALNLGTFYRFGLISWHHPWVQELLRRADESAMKDSTSRPEGMTITEYVAKVFAAIDKKMGK